MYSFDVFGSLVMDTAEKKECFFSFVQNELQKEKYNELPEYIRNNFASLRIRSERMANKVCRTNGKEVISLADVYEVLGLTMVMENDLLELIKKAECDMYVRMAVGIDANIVAVEQLLQRGEKVFFIADTLYDKDVVMRILVKCSLLFADSECFCSSEFGKSQKTGSLYWKINQTAGVKRAEWIYYSTSEINRLSAEKVGLTVRTLREVSGSDEVMECKKISDYAMHMMQEITEVTLLECENVKQEVGVAIGAPILLAYVEWMLKCASELQTDRLFFVARDGYILKKIADKLITHRKLGIETYYVHGSRRAWRMPAFNISSDIVELLRWSHVERVKTYGDLAAIFEISVSELKPFVELKEEIEDSRKISKAALAYCIGKLKHSENFKRYLVEKNKEKRELLREYFAQYIYDGQTRMVFVELAGGGYTQECLSSVLQELGISHVVNFYFKLDSIHSSKSCQNYVFWPNAMKNSAIIETLCHSAEGQTCGYKRVKDKVIPVMAEEEGCALEKYDYDEYVNGILMFVVKYLKYIDGFLAKSHCIKMVSAYMRIIGEKPGKKLSSFIAQMPFGVTGRENEIKEYASGLSEEHGNDNCKHEENECYPVEYVEDGAVVVFVDFFGRQVYSSIRCLKKGIQLIAADKLTEGMEVLKAGCQIVLGIDDVETMGMIKEQLEQAGISNEKILAIDLKPKYVIGI